MNSIASHEFGSNAAVPKNRTSFENPRLARVFQLPSHGRGHRFKPCTAHHKTAARSVTYARFSNRPDSLGCNWGVTRFHTNNAPGTAVLGGAP